MTADLQTFGFPPGYFIIRSLATGRLLDIEKDGIEDGTEIVLWPEKESSLVETMRNPESNNQVFFVDTSGALCSRSAGHAIDVENDCLVLRHRRPVSHPYPNAYSHPLPTFSYSKESGEITVAFASDPAYPPPHQDGSRSWMKNSYVLTSIPMRKPPTFIDNASTFFSNAINNTPLSFMTGKSPPKASSPDEVFGGNIDLKEDEVLEEERGEEGELDDSPEGIRRVRVLAIADKDERRMGEKAKARRRWEVVSLLKSNRKTIS